MVCRLFFSIDRKETDARHISPRYAQDLEKPEPDSRADLAHSFVDAHRHNIEHVDQDDSDQDHLDAKDHHIDHAHHIVKRGELIQVCSSNKALFH